tara:strand:+ start:50 stop:814 length:765 start_codon:yes stop_codon:yes gene_type:complete
MENAIHEDTAEIAGVEGEVLEQVVQPEVVGEAPVDMQAQEEPNVDDAKKFQSMYDKKAAEYDRLNNEVQELRKYSQLGEVLNNRPDVVEAMKNTLSGSSNKPKQEAELTEDSFDPWEAYYKPGSPSYEMRVGQEKALVNDAVKQQFSGMQEQMALNNLKQELNTKYGFNDPQMANDFIQFATQPKEDIPLDMLVDVYRKHRGGEQKISPNLEAVQKAQGTAPTAGVVQGGTPQKPNEMEDVWAGVMGASNRNKI